MAKTLDPLNYEEQELTCAECGWQGKGEDANLIDFYGVADVKELHCPTCDTIIATLKSKS